MVSRKTALAAALMAVSFLVAAVMSVYYLNMNRLIPLEILVFPGVGVLCAALVMFSRTVAEYTELADEVENWRELLADDWHALQNWQFTRTHGVVLLAAIPILVLPVLFTICGKWDATWGGISVVVIAALASAITAAISVGTDWFQIRHRRLPLWVIVIPLIGGAFCTGLGLLFAETGISSGSSKELETSAGGYSQSRGSSIYHHWFSADDFSSGTSISLPECSDDDCGYLYLGLLLIVLVVILALASAFIPHFWMLATLLLGTIYVVIVIRELLFSPRKAKDTEKKKREERIEYHANDYPPR